MSEFEYLAVFVSIIFGISVTHILAGVIRAIYRGERDQTHLVLTAFFFLVLILDWWTGISWRKQEVWTYELFLVIVVWSVTHYLAAITLYPPESQRSERAFEYRRKWFFRAFIAVVATDIMQTAALGALFTPPIYLPFVLHFVVISLLAIFINKPAFHRGIAWYLFLVIAIWSFVVRRYLE